MSLEGAKVQHRDNKLRVFQNNISAFIPGMIGFFDRLGAFSGTRIHDAIKNKSNILQADDITLSQLQMTALICKNIEQKKFFPAFGIEYVLACFLDGADGPVARRLGTVSKEGGIKDAAVDRLSEVMIAKLIASERNFSENLSHDLQVSFQLSTLTKAACEMSDVKTSEGGLGSMIERRKILFFVLQDLINLKKVPDSMKLLRNKLINSIDKRIKFLVESGFERAKERIRLISEKTLFIDAPDDPESSGADEARKYAGVVLLNNRIGIDIVAELNKLAGGLVVFPTVESLIENRDYIAQSLIKAREFLDEALSIAGYEKQDFFCDPEGSRTPDSLAENQMS